MTDAGAPSIAVTGVTGRLGGRVARRLSAAGVAQRMLARDPSRAPELDAAVPARAAFDQPDAVRAALAGIRTVLMVSASETPDRAAQHRMFIDAAAEAGVRHMIYTSFYGASPTCTFTLGRDHFATEEHLRASGMRFTFLRDNFYSDFFAAMVGADAVLRGPAGEGRVSAVAQDDVADAAVAVLLAPDEHVDATYSLTGPQALSLAEAAAILSAETGRSVSYRAESVEEAYASRASYGAPQWQLDAWVSTYTAIANGEVEAVTDDIATLTGHRATSLAELLRRGGGAYAG